LGATYETDFKGYSYGGRPGRNARNALDAVAVGLQRKKVNWVLDADLRGVYDSISHAWLLKFIEHRVPITHICGRTKQGAYTVVRRTQRERMRKMLHVDTPRTPFPYSGKG
jgi:retron-type reverse transcriptase